MRPRISHSILYPGEYNIDTNADTSEPVLDYIVIGDWGNVTIHLTRNKITWDPHFQAPPDWGELEDALTKVEISLDKAYGLNASGLCKRAMIQMQFKWGDGGPLP